MSSDKLRAALVLGGQLRLGVSSEVYRVNTIVARSVTLAAAATELGIELITLKTWLRTIPALKAAYARRPRGRKGPSASLPPTSYWVATVCDLG